MYKVGISRIDANRIGELSERGVTLVDRIQLANQWAAESSEFTVLEMAAEAWVRPRLLDGARVRRNAGSGETVLRPRSANSWRPSKKRSLPCWNATTYRDSGARG